MRGNSVYGTQGPQITIGGSDHTSVQNNTVTAPAGYSGVRVAPRDNRAASNLPPAASLYCDQTLNTAVHDSAQGKNVRLQAHSKAVDYDGIQ